MYLSVGCVLAGTLVSALEAQEKKERRMIRVERHEGEDPHIRVFKPSPQSERRIVRRRSGGEFRRDGAWLGVHIGEVSEVTAAQLGLKPGTGLVVEHVVAKSPAEVAGLKRFDILTAIDGQILVNPDQLQVLVSGNKPGREVSLELLRRGKKMTIEATLEERQTADVEIKVDHLPGGSFLKQGDDVNERVVEKWVDDSEDAEGALDSLIWKGKVRDDVSPFHSRTIQLGNAVTILKDDSGTYHLKEDGGKRHLRFEDQNGEVIFDGVFDGDKTDKLPPEVIKKVEAIRVPEGVDVMRLHRRFDSKRSGPFDKSSDRIELEFDTNKSGAPFQVQDRSL